MALILFDIPRKVRVAAGHVLGTVNRWALHPLRGGTGVSVDTTGDLPAALGVPTNGELTTALSSKADTSALALKADDVAAEHVANKGAQNGYAPLVSYTVPHVYIPTRRKLRQWQVRHNTTSIYSTNGETPTVSTPGAAAAASLDADGSWIQYQSGTSALDSCWIYSDATIRRNFKPRITFRVKFNGITNRAVWVGLFSALPTVYDPVTGAVKCVALRFENPTDNDNLFKFVVSNGTSLGTSTTAVDGSKMLVDAFGAYRFTIGYDGTNWDLEYNNEALATVAGASYGPAGAVDLFWAAGSICNVSTAAKVKFGDVQLEHD